MARSKRGPASVPKAPTSPTVSNFCIYSAKGRPPRRCCLQSQFIQRTSCPQGALSPSIKCQIHHPCCSAPCNPLDQGALSRDSAPPSQNPRGRDLSAAPAPRVFNLTLGLLPLLQGRPRTSAAAIPSAQQFHFLPFPQAMCTEKQPHSLKSVNLEVPLRQLSRLLLWQPPDSGAAQPLPAHP